MVGFCRRCMHFPRCRAEAGWVTIKYDQLSIGSCLGLYWFYLVYMYIYVYNISCIYIYLYIYLNKKVIILHFLSHPKLLWVRGFEFWDIPLGKGLALASREFLSSLALISLPRFRRMFQGKDPGFPNRLESLYKIGGIWQPAFLQRVHPFCQSQTICRVKLKSKT